jgi:hypothetical protein
MSAPVHSGWTLPGQELLPRRGTEQMVRNMFVGRPEWNHDRILDFSTAVTDNICG